jgi:rubrerythrin
MVVPGRQLDGVREIVSLAATGASGFLAAPPAVEWPMSITLAQAIGNAIAAEQAAEKFYLSLAARCADEQGRKVITEIAAQERDHAARLEGVAARLLAGQLPEHADAFVHHIESAPIGASPEGLGLEDALEIAIDAENNSILYYDALASTATGEAAIFFDHVGKEEEAHAAAVRGLLAKVRGR